MAHQWKWKVLRAGALRLDGGGMFGVVPKTLWSRLTEPDEQNRIPLQTNCLLLDDGSTRVIIETGFGNKWSDKERGFYELERRTILDALAEENVEPASIDHVIVTHLHFDHAAGLTHLGDDGAPVSSFPNARVHVSRREWDDALANKAVMTRTYLRSHLDPVADQVVAHDHDREILPGIRLESAPGHTWGHSMVSFADEQGPVCFCGDVMPTRNHGAAAFSMAYDVEPYTSMQTRVALLERAACEGVRVVMPHEPGDAAVTVRAHAERAGHYLLS